MILGQLTMGARQTKNAPLVTNNSASWLFRLSRASPTMDGSGEAHEWFDEKQKVEERTLWYVFPFYLTSPARNLTVLAQRETPEFMPCNMYIVQVYMQSSGLSRTIHVLMLRFALLSLYYTRLWVPFIALGGFGQYTGCGVLCCDPIALWTMHRY